MEETGYRDRERGYREAKANVKTPLPQVQKKGKATMGLEVPLLQILAVPVS